MKKEISIEVISENLQKCWDEYTYYVEKFKKENYSDQKPMDFVDFCENELTICSNCGEVVLKDEIPNNAYNSDNVCEYCINEGGYYE